MRLALLALLLTVGAWPAAAFDLSPEQQAQKIALQLCIEEAIPEEYHWKRIEAAIGAVLGDCLGLRLGECIHNSTEPGQHVRSSYCLSDESILWSEIVDEYYLALQHATAEDDAQGRGGYPPALPSLIEAHEAWKAQDSSDCAYVGDRWSPGTLRWDDPVRCWRDWLAVRAVRYRLWLYDLRHYG